MRYHLVITSVLLFALSLPLTGCHRKFKKFVEQNDEVELTVAVPGRPNVDLVESNGSAQTNIGALVQAATEVAGAVEGVKLRRRLELQAFQLVGPEEGLQVLYFRLQAHGDVEAVLGPPTSVKSWREHKILIFIDLIYLIEGNVD